MRRSGKAKPVVWTWQARFMAEGVDGLLRDKRRKPGKLPLPAATVQRVWNDDTRASAATMSATQTRRSQAAPTTSASVMVSADGT
jgi:hypothetical protein